MTRHSRSLLVAASIVAAASPAFAADAELGLKLSKHWCAACHVVSSDQKSASADVPTFEAIAQHRSQRDLTLFLTKPHGQMPDMALSRPEVADIVAYIESLGPNPPKPQPKPEPPPSGLSGAIIPQK